MSFVILRKIKRIIEKKTLSLFYFFNTDSCLKKTIEQLSLGKCYRVIIPTYDNSDQSVHPSILFLNETKEYMLAFTPYTNSNDKVENPSLVISFDGINFYEELKGLNPLVPAPVKDHNDDPDLFIEDDIVYILYLETERPEKQNLNLLSSINKIKWNNKTIMSQNLLKYPNMFMLSPSYIRVKNKSYIFFINKKEYLDYRVEYYSGKNINCMNFTNSYIPSMNNLDDIPWHLDVITGENNFYYLILSCVKKVKNVNKYYLKIARSKSLNSWSFSNKILLENCYRSSGFVLNNIIYLYVSRIFFKKYWKIELIKFSLKDLFD